MEQKKETNLVGHTHWWAVKKLEANQYFATDKDANLRVQDVGGVSLELCKLVKECAGEEVEVEQRRNRQEGGL